jgi:hypothetical protein
MKPRIDIASPRSPPGCSVPDHHDLMMHAFYLWICNGSRISGFLVQCISCTRFYSRLLPDPFSSPVQEEAKDEHVLRFYAS